MSKQKSVSRNHDVIGVKQNKSGAIIRVQNKKGHRIRPIENSLSHLRPITKEMLNWSLGDVLATVEFQDKKPSRRNISKSSMPISNRSISKNVENIVIDVNIDDEDPLKLHLFKHQILSGLKIVCSKISEELQVEDIKVEEVAGVPTESTLALNYYLDDHVKLPLLEVCFSLSGTHLPIMVDLSDTREEFFTIEEFSKFINEWSEEFVEDEK